MESISKPSVAIDNSMTGISANQDYDQEKRQRTKVACDYCRKRKSKCDGENPCSKCAARNRACVYSHVQKERKQRVKKINTTTRTNRNTNQSSLQSLNKRISTLENLLTTLLTKLDSNNTTNILSATQNRIDEDINSQLSQSGSDSNDVSEDDDMEEFENITEGTGTVRNAELLKESLEPPAQGICGIATGKDQCGLKAIKHKMLQYFGAHSLFFVFSGRFIAWLNGRIEGRADAALFEPLRRMPRALEGVVSLSVKLLSDVPPTVDGDQNFTMNEKVLIYEMLDLAYDRVFLANFLCSSNSIRELFQRYFYGQAQNDDEIISGISPGDYLLMNISLVLCIAYISEMKEVIDPAKYPNLAMKTASEFKLMKGRLFEKSIQSYDKVSRLPELNSIKAIQGLALLILYIESNYITDIHINYILISVLVRLAKEIGIHRVETLVSGDDNENIIRRNLWWFCEFASTEIAFKTGKPMLANMEDVSTLTEQDDFFMSVPTTLFSDDSYLKNSNQIIEYSKSYGHQYYFAYYTLMLTRIKQKSYYKLFSITPSQKNADEMLTVLKELNHDLNKVMSLMRLETKPIKQDGQLAAKENLGLSNELGGDHDLIVYNTILFQLNYFAHSLAINRHPFKKEFGLEARKIVKYGNLSLDSARGMLHLVSNIDKALFTGSALNGLNFYPMVAFFSLLGNCNLMPNGEVSQQDCSLLIEASMDFFAVCSEAARGKDLNNKAVVNDMATRVLLKVLIDTMKKETGIDYYTSVNGLYEHLNSSEMFPETNPKENEMNLDVNISPDSTSSVSISTSSISTENTSPMDMKPTLPGLVNGMASFEIPGLENLVNEITDDNFNYMILNEMNDLPNFFVNLGEPTTVSEHFN